ncbi:MAG: hypothetical protein A2741_01440 [Candidatus Zambryskibacteria bacterium RIFCSPHIGHO2_01_FULL_43_27]|uniref:Lactamase n=1 Tax=Candidatus Zambryskibacteria bacterium RIFCSPLOWO2_01_FULL_43_17 TaxID=1802760 RepID=A0A1G2U175_9BACT|nr:MAG: hypothetical protein A2741_01440 [Candidatus Zambryskibacteria bacterium RIFCSPHIGHO2_01_FULL_43_27]OHA99441.1 MAG: hypothetical protein A3E93_02550 [Candidatus Zambryskibacteria bacterium RIFCSPHIGHO2_12_FULL_43_12b]OHB03276.1 MAG: hypothetical protein A2920_00170 [Candidatus Zambryskibacteria bacterium RIFCSPLOWO2_01_FULL_43_17]
MIITYLGVESLKVQFGDTVIAYNPVSKDSKFKSTKYGADIVLVSVNHKDFNGIDQAARGDKAPFVINGPGEYEIGGIFIRGFHSKTKYDGQEMINTIYLLNLENMNLCFLGALDSATSIDAEASEALDDIDILFAPIGGNGVLSPAEANKIAVGLEPKIIIPIHYGDDISTTALKAFLKEGGEEGLKAEEKLTVKKKDLEGKEGDIVVLAPSAS